MNKILSKEVSFELAKLLFEKQVVIDTEKIWITNAEYGLNNFVGDVCIHWMDEQGYRNSDRKYNAPTIAEVIDFVFEKYNIWVSVNRETIDDSETSFVWCISKYLEEGKDRKKDTWDFYDNISSFSGTIMDWFDTPLEAYEEAIKFILNKQK